MRVAVRRVVAVLSLVLIAASCSSNDGGSDATTTTPVSVATSEGATGSTELTTSTTELILDSGWTQVELNQDDFDDPSGAAMHWVTAGGPGFVAVGVDNAQTEANAAVWTSSDAMTWTRVPDPNEIFGGPSLQAMTSVAAAGPGLVAVGFEGAQGEEVAAIWTSQDGLEWSRVPLDEEIFGGEGLQAMSSVTAGGPGVVAVGLDESAGDQGAAAVWTSPDGLSWTRVPHDEGALGGLGEQSMASVTAGGPGLVAVGADRGAGTGDASAVWTSVDGISWTRVPHDETVFEGTDLQVMYSVAAGGPGLVAVGADRGLSSGTVAAVWTSPDGFEWSRVPHVGKVFGANGVTQMLAVTAGENGGLIASGFQAPEIDPRDADATVWTSLDGIEWTRLPRDSANFGGQGFQSMLSVVTATGQAVGVGADLSVNGLGGAVWVFEG